MSGWFRYPLNYPDKLKIKRNKQYEKIILFTIGNAITIYIVQ